MVTVVLVGVCRAVLVVCGQSAAHQVVVGDVVGAGVVVHRVHGVGAAFHAHQAEPVVQHLVEAGATDVRCARVAAVLDDQDVARPFLSGLNGRLERIGPECTRPNVAPIAPASG